MLGLNMISGGSGHCTTGAGHETPGGVVGGGIYVVDVSYDVGVGLELGSIGVDVGLNEFSAIDPVGVVVGSVPIVSG
jgi:hypothetical protein